ncbi:hypothetical protein PPTG_21523 [Phytophthora nicotianae INRA-310]|uniref:Uncharacterized protein n=1 Tax=Phytophthora nicotianae (strain INRA-310) TaxID=761204 RepID=W2QYR9_PHYN3|nr:hypothetical protein PPTG_21523 [Phytophthora nicotianae INRA-310]ETN18126.1 hypothetical protein PPTG_21523 [Phytophthora nicotianae INRA-310]
MRNANLMPILSFDRRCRPRYEIIKVIVIAVFRQLLVKYARLSETQYALRRRKQKN